MCITSPLTLRSPEGLPTLTCLGRPHRFVDTSVIGDGKLEELRTAVADLAAFVEGELGTATVHVHGLQAGFARLTSGVGS